MILLKVLFYMDKKELENQKANLVNFADSVAKNSQDYAPMGRISLRLDANLSAFETSNSNLVLQNGDRLHVSGRIDTIYVFGEVFNSTTIIYQNDISVDDYIDLAGGLNDMADEDNIYIVKADGTAMKYDPSWFSSNDEFILQRGDTIIVPIELDFISGWQMIKDASQVLYQVGLSAAAWYAIAG